VLPHATPRCAAGACAVASCEAGFADCNGTPADGCEVNTRASAANCGACGRACAAGPNATAACVAGQCAVGACAEGTADCNRSPADGCEVDTRASATNCGACGRACATPNGAAACVGGQCAVGVCRAGYANCDGNAGNGCETETRSDVANCGLCGNACTRPNAMTRCDEGDCRVAACTPGYGDCDSNAGNGCETLLAGSSAHCGACGRACAPPNAFGACAMGACAVAACAPGFADCDNNAGNGCEARLDSAQSCGACGRLCGTGQVCSGGACVAACEAPRTRCGAACVDTRSDGAHCGRCDNACPARPNAAAVCDGGACAIRCAAGFADCDGDAGNGCETDLATSAAHCGRCGNACPAAPNATATCAAAACGFACAAGFGDCDPAAPGCETDLRTTVNSCGACGRRCPKRDGALETCADGACGVACNVGRADCDGDAANGCETDLLGEARNCGACGAVCRAAGIGACRGGACPTCTPLLPNNLTRCPGDLACGTDLLTTPQHCGACMQACPANGTRQFHARFDGNCRRGVCQSACDDGWADCDGNWQNGCERNVGCDSAHCGGCGVLCGPGQACCERQCTSLARAQAVCNLNAPGCR